MKDSIISIVADLLDDRNFVLYALIALAIMTPELREIVATGLLVWWRGEGVKEK